MIKKVYLHPIVNPGVPSETRISYKEKEEKICAKIIVKNSYDIYGAIEKLRAILQIKPGIELILNWRNAGTADRTLLTSRLGTLFS